MLPLRKYLLVTPFLFLSCQSEIDEQSSNMQGTVSKESPLTSYMQRVAMVPTVQDNVVDGSSYCTIKFPYTVRVNNQQIAVNAAADYQKIIDNINASTTDDDIVKIDFPVTMVYYNYIEKFIPNQNDFDTLIDYWNLYPDLLSKINGLNIQYPITINSYNSLNQAVSSQSIVSDQTFFNFIKNLNDSQYISLKYPISVVDYDGKTKSLASNLDFENAIKYAIDYCPENNIASYDFVQTITKGSWNIPYFFDASDQTTSFSGYSFVFKSDNSVTATKGAVTETGQWEFLSQYGAGKLILTFNSQPLSKLKVTYYGWNLFEINNSEIRLRAVSNNSSYLYFSKN
nr:hypothetical protein [uncultured Flavobacterium sp.]